VEEEEAAAAQQQRPCFPALLTIEGVPLDADEEAVRASCVFVRLWRVCMDWVGRWVG
jgi:hypothetical protein